MFQANTYEFPLNERMRNFMRLEYLFAQIDYFSEQNNTWGSQASLLVLIEILNLLERFDIKSEISKELERNIASLHPLLNAPAVDSNKLQQTLDDLATQLHALQNINGKLTRTLREDDLLSTIRQRISISSSIHSFEIPSYYYWLNQAASVRQTQLNAWFAEYIPIADSISLLLDLTRESADFSNRTAAAGFFQQTLTSQQICQMVRIELVGTAKYFPEISGSKHRISVRFLTTDGTKQRPTQVTSDIPFNISCCGI